MALGGSNRKRTEGKVKTQHGTLGCSMSFLFGCSAVAVSSFSVALPLCYHILGSNQQLQQHGKVLNSAYVVWSGLQYIKFCRHA